MKTTNLYLAGLMLVVALLSSAKAADSGPFVGAGVGYAKVDGEVTDVETVNLSVTWSL